MGAFLSAPMTQKHNEAFTSSTGLQVGSSAMQGWRREMEDAHFARDMPSKPDHTFVAVFDGHGGATAAEFAAANLVQAVEAMPEWVNYLAGDAQDTALLGQALSKAFMHVDAALRERKENAGCTSVTAMITPTSIVCANAGDSRCVLGTNNTTKPLSFDHKPDHDGEKSRIEAAGGEVLSKRVNGELAVSRALGDFQYKSSVLLPENQMVTCVPDITIHRRTAADEFLILACDGLWDVLTSEEALGVVRQLFRRGSTIVKIAEDMLSHALYKESKDNISAVLVQLPGAREPTQSEQLAAQQIEGPALYSGPSGSTSKHTD